MRSSITRFVNAVRFAWYYLIELVRSNFRLMLEVITVRNSFSPQVITVGVEGLSPLRTVLLANLITMTPGTLVIDYLEEEQTLKVHVMYPEDGTALRAEILPRYRTIFEEKRV